jgi:uncharacterized membrane protein YkvA (DUF1232 family)
MPLKVELELSDNDLNHFREVLDATWRRNEQRDDKDLVDSVHRALDNCRNVEMPEYVRKRLEDLRLLASMLVDSEWNLEERDRGRIKAATAYFAEPNDLVPDTVPGLGFLDDAIIAELVIREVEHELAGYREFCEFRTEQERLRGKNAHLGREDWLAEKRRQMILRIRQRRDKELSHGSRVGLTDPILRYQY